MRLRHPRCHSFFEVEQQAREFVFGIDVLESEAATFECGGRELASFGRVAVEKLESFFERARELDVDRIGAAIDEELLDSFQRVEEERIAMQASAFERCELLERVAADENAAQAFDAFVKAGRGVRADFELLNHRGVELKFRRVAKREIGVKRYELPVANREGAIERANGEAAIRVESDRDDACVAIPENAPLVFFRRALFESAHDDGFEVLQILDRDGLDVRRTEESAEIDRVAALLEMAEHTLGFVEEMGFVLLPVLEAQSAGIEAVDEFGSDHFAGFTEIFQILVKTETRGIFIRLELVDMLSECRDVCHLP